MILNKNNSCIRHCLSLHSYYLNNLPSETTVKNENHTLSAHSKCLLCNNGEDEDLEHFLLNCPVLSSVRDEYFNIVSKQSSEYYIGVDFMELSPSAKLQFIVGDIGYAFNNDIGIFYDFIGKMYIETCFRLRSEVLSVTV